ncbi:MAG: NAD-dependent epimerase/dehydratase family protein [Eubacteriales bacterium]|nr:NAD-dependent epimerase/dehydratase family protein [Eubacteriales bacterium]
MRWIYLVTGAAGHLGLTVTEALIRRGDDVRALVLPQDEYAPQLPEEAKVYVGDVCAPATLEDAFTVGPEEQLAVVHCAGLVSIASRYQQAVYDVNVTGTRNVIAQCEKHGAARLVYVSSVHALPALPKGEIIREIDSFDPAKVSGLYAQTKAEATASVLEAARRGLNASVVHPSGIFGPNDYGRGHLTQLVCDCFDGRLTAGIAGGYDMVDVRDVAAGILSCLDKGRAGECYLLSNRYVGVPEIFEEMAKITGHKRVTTFLPLWFIRWVAPLAELYYRLRRQTPLFTAYSIETLESNALFSHEKAARELGFAPRPFEETLRDTVAWLDAHGRFQKSDRHVGNAA